MMLLKAATAVGEGANVGLAAIACVLFVRFFLKWCGERWDAHVKRMAEREKIAGDSIIGRIRHLEEQQVQDARLIAGLYRAVHVLTARLAPHDPALVEVRDIIAAALNTTPGRTPQDMVELVNRLGGARQ